MSSRKSYSRAWDYFVNFLEDKTEDWIFEHKITEDWGSHLVDFNRWLKKQPKQRGQGTLSDNSAKQISGAIRGYMLHVGLPLSLTRAQKDELDKVESLAYRDYVFDLKTKEELLRKANPLEEYIISVGISFGLRISDFVGITRGMLEPLLDKEIPIQLPKIMTKKKGEVAYPLIDGDAHQAIKRLLKQMNEEGRTDPDEPMIKFTNTRKYPENTVNTILKNLAEKSGINLGKYRLRTHCLRKFLTDKLSSVCAQDKWKWFVGKSLSGASPYVGHEGREAYKLVMRFTQVNGNRARGTISNTVLEKQLKLRDEEIEILKDEMTQLQERLAERDGELTDLENKLTETQQKTNSRFALIERTLRDKGILKEGKKQ